MNLVFDLFFCYDDDNMRSYRPFVINCPLSRISYYSGRVGNLCRVSHISINIHKSTPDLEFQEFTI